MARYINPFTDWGFKRLFGQEFSKDLLISFLNDLLVGELHVRDVTFKDKEQLADTKEQRGLIYDVYCETDTGDRFIVEMQNRWQPNFLDRSICYACRSLLEQVKKGKGPDAYKLLPVYTVCFMNYMPRRGEVTKFRTDMIIADRDTKEMASDKLRFIYLALPLFKKTEDECATDFEKWIYVLTHMEALTRMPFTAQKKIFEKLAEYADRHHLNSKEYEQYENSLWIARDNMACIEATERELREAREAKIQARRQGLEEGRQEGIKQGRQEGIKQGRQEGIEQGIEQGMVKQKADTARKMLAKGLSLDDIMLFTGLTEEQIRNLE